MKRVVLVGYAAAAYGSFLVVVGWAVAFLADVGGDIVPGVDRPATTAPAVAVAVDLVLLGVFALHHSVMARPAAKRVLARLVPPAAERSTYVLVADLLLALLLWQWRAVDGTVWEVVAQPWREMLWAVYLAGWLVAVASTFMIDHLDFVGLRQAATAAYVAPTFTTRGLYAVVRHPVMLGLLVALWATPTMSAGHLLFAAASSAYVLVGTRLEEADLRRSLGAPYADYARRTPALLPVRRRGAAQVRRPRPDEGWERT